MTVNMSLDGLVCLIQRPLDNLKQCHYYSGKSRKHCIKYELGTQLFSGRIVWMSGGIPGSVHDLDLARAS